MHLLVSYFPVSFFNELPLRMDYDRILPNEILCQISHYWDPSIYPKVSLISYQFYLVINPLKKKFKKNIEDLAQTIFRFVKGNLYRKSYLSFLSTNLRIDVFPVIEQRFSVKISLKNEDDELKIGPIMTTLIKNHNYKPFSELGLDDKTFCIIGKVKSSYYNCCLVRHCTEIISYVSNRQASFTTQKLLKSVSQKIEYG